MIENKGDYITWHECVPQYDDVSRPRSRSVAQRSRTQTLKVIFHDSALIGVTSPYLCHPWIEFT
jgi:hypothetical protein